MDGGLRALHGVLEDGLAQDADGDARPLEVQPVQVAAQLRLDDAGVHGVRGDGEAAVGPANPVEPPGQLLGEEHVGQLALLVRLERLVRARRVEVVEVDAACGTEKTAKFKTGFPSGQPR